MMPDATLIHQTAALSPKAAPPPDGSCILVIFGASGDLTRRLLMPALYNLACDGLLPPRFAMVGLAMDELSTVQFRERMTVNMAQFNTRPRLDPAVWESLMQRLHYTPGTFEDPAAYVRLAELLARLDRELHTGGNLLFYFAAPPSVVGPISARLIAAGLGRRPTGWTRLIIEKPFGHDLASAVALNRELLVHWTEDQLYRIDHYLGKETVQNLLAFRFANGTFEPLWNKNHIDHIQLTVAETVGVEGRGSTYDRFGCLRDMIQNHMLQMLAYVCMEPPSSLRADAVRTEKAKLLEAVRLLKPAEVAANAVRGQYGPGRKLDGTPAMGYRQEPAVDPNSVTETFAAVRLFIDNWRWEGVPIYLRSGKSLWKRGTEIVVQFKRAPDALFRATPAEGQLGANRLIFHIQPDQGIEFRFHAKTPGPTMALQKVNMRFDYKDAFEAARGTGYEVLLYNAIAGDTTQFTRTDLVESAWRIAQPLLDAWSAIAPTDFPNYPAGTWGPPAAYALLERDGRRWLEIVNRNVLEKVPLLRGADPLFLHNLALMLQPAVVPAGATIVQHGDTGNEMYFICRGQAEVLDRAGKLLNVLDEGNFFGELSLLLSRPRTATVRAATPCDLFVLGRADFDKALRDHPQLAASLQENARSRYADYPSTK
jgi:glucose-6-phosphate 1-dehydrogenase